MCFNALNYALRSRVVHFILALSHHNKSTGEKGPREWAVTAREPEGAVSEHSRLGTRICHCGWGEPRIFFTRALECVRSIVPRVQPSPFRLLDRGGVGGLRAMGEPRWIPVSHGGSSCVFKMPTASRLAKPHIKRKTNPDYTSKEVGQASPPRHAAHA